MTRRDWILVTAAAVLGSIGIWLWIVILQAAFRP